MEEVLSISASAWTDTINLLSFVANRRNPLEWSPSPSGETCVALMLAGAEIERVSIDATFDLAPLSRLTAAICSSPTVSSLILCGYSIEIGTQLVQTLAPAFIGAKSLRKLILNNYILTHDNLDTLAKVLGPKSDLQISMRLDYEKKEPTQFILALARIHSLQKLDVIGSKVDIETLSDALKKSWRNLQSLTIARIRLGAADGRAIGNALERVACGLRTLNLEENDLEDSGIAAIVDGLLRGYSRAPGKKGELQKLFLDGNIPSVASAKKVTRLVEANPHLKRISMQHNSAAGAALGESFRGCAATLRVLNLSGSRLSPEAVIAICHSLADSYSLTTLDINFARLRTAVEATRAISRDLLAESNSLEELTISGCYMELHAAKELIDGFARNSSLKLVDLSINKGVGAEITELLKAMLHLELKILNLSDCGIDDIGGKAVGTFVALSPRLQKIDLSDNKLHAEGAKEIVAGAAQSHSLDELRLAGNEIGDEGAKYVVELFVDQSKTVRKFEISSEGMSVEGVKIIAKAVARAALDGTTTLRNFYIDTGPATKAEVKNIIESLRKSPKQI